MTRTVFRRIDPPAANLPPAALADDHSLPILTRLAADLLSARARAHDPWQHAPTLRDVAPLGHTTADCLALIARGLLTVLPSPSGSGHGARGSRSRTGRKRSRICANKSTRIGPRTRLLLTDLGLALITKHAQSSRIAESSPLPPESGYAGQGAGASPTGRSSTPQGAPSVSSSPTPLISSSSPPHICLSQPLPHYDIDLRELSVAGIVIMCLPVQARNLAAVLTTLEQAGWKPRVPKPLNGRPGGNDHHHLAIAAYKLNSRQSLIEFHADDGAIRWTWRRSIQC